MRKDVLPLNVPDPLPPPQKSLPVGVAEVRQFIGGSCACTGIVDDARNEPVCRIGVIGQNVAPYRSSIRRRRFVACRGPGERLHRKRSGRHAPAAQDGVLMLVRRLSAQVSGR
jgi:hypothetical protein